MIVPVLRLDSAQRSLAEQAQAVEDATVDDLGGQGQVASLLQAGTESMPAPSLDRVLYSASPVRALVVSQGTDL